jgi:isopenicillin N synthase-like dioxygenase
MRRFWTNDLWRSTRHRVVVRPPRHPPLSAPDHADGANGAVVDTGNDDVDNVDDRMSLIFFHMPNYDAVIDCADCGTVGAERPRRQELTLVHLSAQPEPYLTPNTPFPPPNTPGISYTPAKQPLNNPSMHPLSHRKRLR